MAFAEARLARLEDRVVEHSQTLMDMRQTLGSLERRVDGLRSDLSTDFRWLVGIQITTLVAIVAALVSAFFAR